jgi:hypothetical protein
LRARPGLFLLAGLLIFIPLGLADVLDDEIQEPLSEVDIELTGGQLAAAIAAAVGHSAAALLGDVLYTGIVARAVVSVRHGEHRSLREIVRTLPYLKLIAADILLAIIVGLGLLALIVPGFLFLAWFALIAPAIELEERGVRDAFRRSRALVRGNTMRVLVLIVPLVVLDDVLSNLVQTKESFGIESSFFVDWGAAVLTDLLTGPLYALIVVVTFFQLRDGPT